jgi:hypothetical protein
LVAADQASARHMALAAGLTAQLCIGSAQTAKRRDSVIWDSPGMLVELHSEGGMLSFEHTLTNPQIGQT